MSQESKGLPSKRNCPILDKTDKDTIKSAAKKSSVNRYAIAFSKDKQKKKVEKVVEENDDVILCVEDYEFTSCPTAVLIGNRGLTKLIDLINWSVDMHTPLFGDGLNNYSNFLFECHQIVVGEQRSIENEVSKRQREESKSSSKKSAGKTKGRNGKNPSRFK